MTQEQLVEGNRLVNEIRVLRNKVREMTAAWEELQRRKDSDTTVFISAESVSERVPRAALMSMFWLLKEEYSNEILVLDGKLKEL